MTPGQTLRILDANFNRSREGLRVCEEIARFVLNEKALTLSLKKARHDVTGCLNKLPVSYAKLVASRDTASDVGKGSTTTERSRKNTLDLFLANMERAKESLRVLEEISKFVDPRLSLRFKKIRFNAYAAEKKALPRLAALRRH